MEWILTGDFFDAHQAEKAGLVSKVVPSAELLSEVEKMSKKIASMSLPTTILAKECVNAAYENTLSQGLVFERRLFHSSFATV